MARRTWKVELIRSVGAAAPFSSLLTALGVHDDRGTFVELLVDRRRVTLKLRMHKERTSGLDIELDWAGGDDLEDAPFIVLRPETATDVEGKRRDINAEVELNDEPFDREVYIDSNASDGEVRRVLSDIRRPVLAMVEGGARLKLSPKALTAHWSFGVGRPAEELLEGDRLLNELARLLEIARAGAPRVAEVIPRRGEGLPLLWGLGLAGALALTFVAVSSWPGAHTVEATGAALGALVALLLRGVFERQVKGDSGSFTRYRITLLLAVVVLALCGLSLATIINGAFDSTPARVREGVVTEQHSGSKGARSHTVRWRDGSHSTFGGSVANGTSVSQALHRGVFGEGWHEPPSYR